MTKKTCGVYYKEGLDHYNTSVDAKIAFTSGFVSGQAEKVFLGACRAAMFRPSEKNHPMLLEIVKDVTKRYELYFSEKEYSIWHPSLQVVERFREFWIYKDPQVAIALGSLFSGETANSEVWHYSRAILCGIPTTDIDLKFHNRKGFGEDCD